MGPEIFNKSKEQIQDTDLLIKNSEFKTLQLNTNTQYLDQYPPENKESLRWISTPKINKRLCLNKVGLNRLATTVIHPSVSGNLVEMFSDILDFSNKINDRIGLPQTNDLIVRSSVRKSTSLKNFGKYDVSDYSSPALLVTSASNDNPKYKLLTENNKTKSINSIEDFINLLGIDYFLLIHDDNLPLQQQAVHGRICAKNTGVELVLATKVIHARELGVGNPDYPFIEIRSQSLDDIYSINPSLLLKGSEKDRVINSQRMEILIKNCTQRDVSFLITKAKREELLLQHILDKTHMLFGENSVAEFRSYNVLEGGIGEKIHVLDVDDKF
jgi:hypothetical protein